MTSLDHHDAIEAFCHHVVGTDGESLPGSARAAARRFILDSVGVGISGSAGPYTDEIVSAHTALGAVAQSRVWGRSVSLPAPHAALCNAYQIHNAEFDCVHELAVVHPMAVLLGAAAAHADRASVAGEPVSGRALLDAVILGVDVAAGIGVGSRSPLRFFRPGTAGAFGAVAAVGRLAGFDAATLQNAMGLVLAQMGGTMQAHVEGSPALAMQVGFNARNAIVACDLAAGGVPGPAHVLEGQFGYYPLFEGEHAVGEVLAQLGSRYLIEEVAHKPFPSGRATHGIVDACLTLRDEHGFVGAEVAEVQARVPPLTHRLVGRPPAKDMTVNYARLCGAYVTAVALLRGAVGLEDFRAGALTDRDTLAMAGRVHMETNDNPDPNALTPLEVSVRLHDGRCFEQRVDVIYGNPARPMQRDAYLGKFRSNWRAAREPLPPHACEPCIERLEHLDDEADFAAITATTQPVAG